MRAGIVIGGLSAAAAFAPAAAVAAPTLQTDRQCYTPGEDYDKVRVTADKAVR